jgi:DNA repair exonuclease SbcCD nuclease subunit
VKILFSSDWHLDHVTAGKARFDEVCDAVDETVRAAVEARCSHYFFLGDLMDHDSGSVTYRALEFVGRTMRWLQTERITSHWLAGNHDVVEDGRGTTTLTPLNAFQAPSLTYVYERPEVVAFSDLTVVALPYTATSHAYDPVAYVQGVAKGCSKEVPTIVIGHLCVAGVIPGEETLEMPRGRDVVFPRTALRECLPEARLFNGHYHKRQVHDGVHIPGSLARLTFGEQGHVPGYLVVEV